MKMKVYNCQVRPAGWMLHEVPKFKLTAAEIAVIRMKHLAHDAVPPVSIKDAGHDDVDEKRLRKHLVKTYGQEAVEKAIGRFGQLPKTVDDLPEDPFRNEDMEDDEPVAKEPVKAA